eukprot:Skav235688  [mRNA]  locus=scaffold280:106357:107422:+ [translate_table: standard]
MLCKCLLRLEKAAAATSCATQQQFSDLCQMVEDEAQQRRAADEELGRKQAANLEASEDAIKHCFKQHSTLALDVKKVTDALGEETRERQKDHKVLQSDVKRLGDEAKSGSEVKEQRQEPSAREPPQRQPEWVRYTTSFGQVFYEDEATGQRSWTLPPGVTAAAWSPCGPRQAAGPSERQQGTGQSEEEDWWWAEFRKQQEEFFKTEEEFENYCSQREKQQQQQQQQQQQAYVPRPAPPYLGPPPHMNASLELHRLYQIKTTIRKEMESRINEGMKVKERQTALRNRLLATLASR